MPLPIQLICKTITTIDLEKTIVIQEHGRFFKKKTEWHRYIFPKFAKIHYEVEIVSQTGTKIYDIYSGNVQITTSEYKTIAHTDDNYPKPYTVIQTIRDYIIKASQMQLIAKAIMDILNDLDKQGWNVDEPAKEFLPLLRTNDDLVAFRSIGDEFFVNYDEIKQFPEQTNQKIYTISSR